MSYQPMHGAWYRVLTLTGETIEKMQYKDGAFHGLARRGATARVIPMGDVERVAVRYAPGVSGGGSRWLVVNTSPHAQSPGYRAPVFERRRSGADDVPKTRSAYGSLPATLLVALDEHGPQSTADLVALLPGLTNHSVRTTLSRMTHAHTVSRTADGKRWQIGAPTAELKGRPFKDEAWEPQPWVHPNLTRKQRPEPEPLPLDYSDPRRRAA